MNVLTIDVGGTNVKILATGQAEARKFESGPEMTPEMMVKGVKSLAKDWAYDVIAIGYPGPMKDGLPVVEPRHLAKGWVGFDFQKAFGKPVRLLNDAAMQALGSYQHGKMLFLGLGTGLGSAMVIGGAAGTPPTVVPMELAHLPYRKATFEDYVGVAAREKYGKKKWRALVADVVGRLNAALQPDDTVIGGGNVKLLKELPPGCRAGSNGNAFLGGFRLWEHETSAAK